VSNLDPPSNPGGLKAELRRDRLTGKQVIVVPGRSDRPHPVVSNSSAQSDEYCASCPLCVGNEQETPPSVLTLARPDSRRLWDVRVIPNLYPVVSAESKQSADAGSSIHPSATGIHEVVVETPSHNRELPDRELSEVLPLLDAYRERLADLEARRATRHVVVFKNRGLEAGTSLDHPHSQIIALDFLPNQVTRRTQIARRHLRTSGGCLLCSIVAEERQSWERIVFKREGFVAFSPYASSSAGEVLLVPLMHAPSFTTISSKDREQLAGSLIALLRQMQAAFNDPAYNLVLHTAPKPWHDDAALHWYWQLTPRLTRTAGLELATDLNVNPLAPEYAASQLRNIAAPRGDLT